MKRSTQINNLIKIKEAFKQADANIKFEEVNSDSKKKPNKNDNKILTRGKNYDKRPLG